MRILREIRMYNEAFSRFHRDTDFLITARISKYSEAAFHLFILCSYILLNKTKQQILIPFSSSIHQLVKTAFLFE